MVCYSAQFNTFDGHYSERQNPMHVCLIEPCIHHSEHGLQYCIFMQYLFKQAESEYYLFGMRKLERSFSTMNG